MDIALVADIKNNFVFRRLKNPVQGDGELDDAEIRPEVSAGGREHADQLAADFGSQPGHGIG